MAGPYWPSYPNHPNWRCRSGNGGSGKVCPNFSNPIIGPYCPLIPGPSKSEIGPQGYYGGGGGGGAPDIPWVTSGNGGQGGGGHGGHVNYPVQVIPTIHHLLHQMFPQIIMLRMDMFI